jgi:CRP-like cAMP-binding protein
MPHVDLLELPYFEGISIDALVSLVELMQPERFEQDAIIFSEGQPVPPPLYIATQGRVGITKRGPQRVERCLAEFDSPTLFGEVELFCQIPPVATARALTPLSAFKLTRDTFEHLFAAHHAALLRFTYNVARVACHRLAVADEIMTRTLDEDDLVKARRAVFATMADEANWPEITGAFKRPF